MTNLIQICDTIVQWLSEATPQRPDWSPGTWETFKFVCRVHGVTQLLHEKLNEINWLDVSLQNWLDEQYHANIQRIAKMQAELKAILNLAATHHLPLMPLKGSILSVDFYELGLRPMADLDLLIRPEAVGLMRQLLAQLGYEQEIVHWKHTEFVKPGNRQVVSTDSEHPDNPRKLEIHLYCRETFAGPIIDLTELMWANSRHVQFLGEPAYLPSPEALWLHLLVHHTYHTWQGKGRLIQLIDLAQITQNRVSQRNPVFKTTEALTLLNSLDARFTYPSLTLLKKYFPTALDDVLLASQAARVSTSFRSWVASLDLVNTSYLNPKPGGLYLFKALKFSEGRPYEAAQALRFALLPGLDEIALDHPKLAQSKLLWLAYFLLPLDWARRLSASRKT